MDAQEARSLFMPHTLPAIARLQSGKRLVHYTSAEAAYRIITGGEVWLRSVHLMNDYSELRHGLTCLQRAWASPAGVRLQTWLDEKRPGLRDRLQQTFDGHADGLLEHTYILSLSEHDDDEDKLGRLSMWRAYGGRSGVALVLNTQTFLSETDLLAVFSSPVIYMDADAYVAWFSDWVKGLIDAEGVIEQMDQEELLGYLFFMFRVTVLATKHPGFHEEKEWRVFHSPVLDGQSDWVRLETDVVNGVPQPVVKFQLQDDPTQGVDGVGLPSLLNRVIIGPCESPMPIRNALWNALDAAAVQNLAEKMWMSFIPLRQR